MPWPNRQGQKLDWTTSPALDHSDQLGLNQIGLKILRGTRTDLKIFRRYKKYDLPETSACIGLHFTQQQPGKMQDHVIRHFVTLVVLCFLSFQYWFPVSRCTACSTFQGFPKRFPVQFSQRPTFSFFLSSFFFFFHFFLLHNI